MGRSPLSGFVFLLSLESILINRDYFFLLGEKVRPKAKFLWTLNQKKPDLYLLVIWPPPVGTIQLVSHHQSFHPRSCLLIS